MASRTYIPSLVKFAKVLRLYVVRNRETLRKGLSEAGNNALDSLIGALDILIPLAEDGLPNYE